MKADFSMYLATDRGGMCVDEFCAVLDRCILAGVTVVQLREKNVSAGEFFEIGQRVHEVTRRRNVPLIINDRLDVMLALDAEGVHVGPKDLPAAVVRKLIGPDKILGCSANTADRLRSAEEAGADYVGCGPVFQTGTKLDTGPVLGPAGLKALVSQTPLPCVAIGGLDRDNVEQLQDTGIAGACVISAVWKSPDPAEAVAELKSRLCL